MMMKMMMMMMMIIIIIIIIIFPKPRKSWVDVQRVIVSSHGERDSLYLFSSSLKMVSHMNARQHMSFQKAKRR